MTERFRLVEDNNRSVVLVFDNQTREEIWIPREKFEKSRLTTGAKARRLSHYCTDYPKHKEEFDAPFNPHRSPAVLKQFEDKILSSAVLVISCSPDVRERVAADLTAAGLSNADDYIRLSTEKSHGEKYDLLIEDPKMPEVDFALGIFFNPIRLQATGRYQIGKKDYIFRVLSQVRVLEVGESLPEKP